MVHQEKTKEELMKNILVLDQRVSKLEEMEEIYRQIEEECRSKTSDLIERVEELNCLYSLSKLLMIEDTSLKDVLKGAIELIPPSFQYPEITCAMISTDGEEIHTTNFKETPWKLSAKIKVGGVETGQLQVGYLEEKPKKAEGPFLQEERNLLEEIATRLGDFIGQKRAQEKLKESEQRFHSFFKNELEFCYMISRDGSILDVNSSALEFLGYRKDQLIGEPVSKIYAPETQSRMKKNFKKWKENGEIRDEEMVIISKDGKKKTVLLSVNSIRDENGEILHSISVQKDITDRMKAQEALRESEEKYSTLVERANDAVVIIQDGIIRFANQGASKIIGYPLEDIAGTQILKFLTSDSKQDLLKIYKDRMAGVEVPSIYEATIVHKDGTEKDIEISATIIQYQGKPADLIVARDITDRKRAQEQILLANKRLEYLLSSSSAIIHTCKASGDYRATFVGENVLEMTGYEAQQFLREEDFWSNHIHPEDLEKVDNEISKVFKKDRHTYEYRFRCKDGSYIWVSDEIKLARCKDGQPLEILGYWMDITDKKEAEEALRRSEEKFSKAFHASPDAIILSHVVSGKIYEVNEGFEKILEYSRDEVIGKTTENLNIWQDPTAREKIFKKLIEGETIRDLELGFRKKSGECLVGSLTIGLIELKDEKYAISIARDITAHKRSEEALRDSEVRFRELANLLPEIVFETDLRGNLTFANQAAFGRFGYSKEEFEKGVNAINMLVPSDREHAGKNIERILMGEDIGGTEYMGMCKDGSRFPILIHSSPIIKDGRPIGLRGIAIDISVRKKAEEAILKRDMQLEKLSRATQKLNTVLETPTVLRTLVASAMELVEARIGTAGLIEDEKIVFNELNREGNLTPIGLYFKPGYGIPGRVMENKIPYISNDPQNNSIVIQEVRSVLGYNNVICLPIMTGSDKVLGCLEVFNTKDGRPLDSHDVEMLQVLTASATTALENAKHLEDIKRTQEALVASEERYRLLFNKSRDLIILHRFDAGGSIGQIIEVNDTACEKLGYSKEELLNFTPSDLLDHDAAKNETPEGLSEGRESRYERELRTRDGDKIIVEFNSFRLTFNGEDCVLAIGRDITNRKKAEQELRKSEERYRTYVSNISDSIIELDSQMIFTYVSPQINGMFGFSPEEILGKSAMDFIHQDDIEGAVEAIERALESKEIIRLEFRSRHKMGHYVNVVGTGKVMETDGGFKFIGLIRDITERNHV